MKSISSKKPFYKRKKFLILALIIVALAATASVYAFNVANEQEKEKTSETPSSIDKDNSKSLKDKDKEQTYKSVPASDSQDKEAVQAENVEPSAEVEAPNITRAEQTGDFIRVSAIFSNPSNGTCTLRFEQAGQQAVQAEAPVVVGPSYYTCNGFRIPVAEFPSKGSWDITVTHTMNGKTANTKGSVNVQ